MEMFQANWKKITSESGPYPLASTLVCLQNPKVFIQLQYGKMAEISS